ncbi:MAG TPA: adenosylcobinamide-GDP ribazoletransferase [Clostridiaceae bacterium]|nr:adenosylcobinamide-GDP ribazoletransferase [Clostridiaceae bacterium]
MRILRSISLALAFFTKLPMPKLDWSEDNMRYLPAAFPLVGVLIGLLLQAWLWLSRILAFGTFVFAAGLTLIPLAVTGGIHLDGFCDTADALASRAPMEKKQEILADPRTGAFAIISLAAYMAAYLAFASEWPPDPKKLAALGLAHVLGRTLVAFGLVYYPAAREDGFFASLSKAAKRGPVTAALIFWLLLTLAGLYWTSGWPALIPAALVLLYSLHIRQISVRHFGGMNGDLAGYWLQMTELILLVLIGRTVVL